jgi:aspartyl-tRNA(Asn)/glutamyl-tRNA(Gln) amidotransferase subunit B
MEELRNILRYLSVCDGNLEEGSLRCDANISLRPWGQKKYGTKVEIKNLNSFKALQKSLEHEIERQTNELDRQTEIIQETRLWKDDEGITISMRTKEEAHDYRYFPEPDLVPMEIDAEWVHRIRENMPELPEEKKQRYINEIGLSESDAIVLAGSCETANFFDQVCKVSKNPKATANWLMGDIAAYLNDKKINIANTKLLPDSLAEMVQLIDSNTISNTIAKKIIITLLEEGGSAKNIVEKKGLSVISDEGQLKDIVKKILDENPKEIEKFKAGKTQVLGFFVGQAMKITKGKGDPGLLNKIFSDQLEKI